MTPAQLAAIREREAQATAGPWQIPTSNVFRVIATKKRSDNDHWGAAVRLIVEQPEEKAMFGAQDLSYFLLGEEAGGKQCADDRRFIAHSREDIPLLLSALDAATAEVERMRKAADKLIAAVEHMKSTEEAGGSDWWRAWDKVRYEAARAKAPELCGATTETDSGEYVSPCRKPKGHSGEHEGSCLGSRAVWTDESTEGTP